MARNAAAAAKATLTRSAPSRPPHARTVAAKRAGEQSRLAACRPRPTGCRPSSRPGPGRRAAEALGAAAARAAGQPGADPAPARRWLPQQAGERPRSPRRSGCGSTRCCTTGACTRASTSARPCGTPVHAAADGDGDHRPAGAAATATGSSSTTGVRRRGRPGHDVQPPEPRSCAQRAREPGPADRLLRHHGPVDRLPPALRDAGERHAGQPAKLALRGADSAGRERVAGPRLLHR